MMRLTGTRQRTSAHTHPSSRHRFAHACFINVWECCQAHKVLRTKWKKLRSFKCSESDCCPQKQVEMSFNKERQKEKFWCFAFYLHGARYVECKFEGRSEIGNRCSQHLSSDIWWTFVWLKRKGNHFWRLLVSHSDFCFLFFPITPKKNCCCCQQDKWQTSKTGWKRHLTFLKFSPQKSLPSLAQVLETAPDFWRQNLMQADIYHPVFCCPVRSNHATLIRTNLVAEKHCASLFVAHGHCMILKHCELLFLPEIHMNTSQADFGQQMTTDCWRSLSMRACVVSNSRHCYLFQRTT